MEKRNAFIFQITSSMLGVGKRRRTNCSFNFCRSETERTPPSFLDLKKEGDVQAVRTFLIKTRFLTSSSQAA